MPDTLIEYIQEYGDTPFKQKPLNDVDSLALCLLSYLQFDDIVPDIRDNRRAVAFERIKELGDYDKLFVGVHYEKESRALIDAMLGGCRYRNMMLYGYINLTSEEWETQFSAVTFLLGDGSVYVAYRGTDETIVGWKEDFNMTFLFPVPAQVYSVKYLNMALGKQRMSFYMGGHSKGGNLAIYAAMNCSDEMKGRIQKIYCMDGPGFRPDILESDRYEQIADRIVKILPQSSLVGMLFENDTRYQVVDSKSIGIAQHNAFSWVVKDGDFKWVDDIYGGRKFMDETINEWIMAHNEEERKLFVDTFYQVISASEAKDLSEFTADWKKNMNAVITALKEVDEQTKTVLKEIIRSLFSLAGAKMKDLAETKVKDLTGVVSRDKEGGKSKDLGEVNSKNLTEAKSRDKAGPKPKDKARVKPEDKARVKPEDKAGVKLEDKAGVKSKNLAVTKSRGKAGIKSNKDSKVGKQKPKRRKKRLMGRL